MLSPKRTKFRKSHTMRLTGVASRGNKVSFGDFALQAMEGGHVDAREIEAARMSIMRKVKRAGKLYIRVFPDHPFTKKPAETRMGTGKGGVEGYVAVVKPGRVIFEVEGVPYEVAKVAFERAHHKLTVKTQLVSREPVL